MVKLFISKKILQDIKELAFREKYEEPAFWMCWAIVVVTIFCIPVYIWYR